MSTRRDCEIRITESPRRSTSYPVEDRIVECWLHSYETTTSGNILSRFDSYAPGDRRRLRVRSAAALRQTTTGLRIPCLRFRFRCRGGHPSRFENHGISRTFAFEGPDWCGKDDRKVDRPPCPNRKRQ